MAVHGATQLAVLVATVLGTGAALPPAPTELPPCDFEACAECLPAAIKSRVNLSMPGPDGLVHEAPLRVGRALSLWDSESVAAHIVGILVTERLGINVQYADVVDEMTSWFAVNNCIGWKDLRCDQYEVVGDAGLAEKAFRDVLPDAMFVADLTIASLAPENFQGMQLQYDDRTAMSIGPEGFTVLDGLFVPADVATRAHADGVDLRWFPALEAADWKKYFDTPSQLIADGVVPLVKGCGSDSGMIESAMTFLRGIGWLCTDDWWWVNPACQAYGDRWRTECMVMLDDDWGYQKPDLYTTLAHIKVPLAKVTVGYDRWIEILTQNMYNISHNWWTQDASLAMTMPTLLRLPWESEAEPNIRLKGVWKPAMQASPRLSAFLNALYLKPQQMRELINMTAEAYRAGYQPGHATFQKVVCDWLRVREDVWTQWLPTARDCFAGQVFNETSQQCLPCPVGTYSTGRPPHCVNCTPGTFNAVAGATACYPCAAGRYTTATGASTADVCERCIQGSFADGLGMTACKSCNSTFSTNFPGAADASDCMCPEGSFYRTGDDEVHCAPCVTGLLCPGGDNPPLQAAGFAVDIFTSGGPKVILACDTDLKCPGGTPLGTCPEHREGAACDLCSAWTYEQSGVCVPCKGAVAVLPSAAVLTGCILAIAALIARGVRGHTHVNSSAMITLLLTAGLTLTTLQVMSAFKKLMRSWPDPLPALYSALRVFSFDIELLRFSCILRLNQPAYAYLGSLMVHPCFAVVLVLAMLVTRTCGFKVPIDEVLNAQGITVMTVYVALTVTALQPWQCTGNPDGTSSVATRRSIRCWSSSEHKMMLGFSVVALAVYVVGAFAVALWATWNYPSMIHQPDGGRFITRFQFLFGRFKAQHYRYAVLFMFRNLLVSILPIVLVNEPQIAVMFLLLVIAAGCAIQCRLYPWRTVVLNHMDAMASVAVILILAGGAFVMDGDVQHSTRMVQYFYLVLFLTLLTVVVAVSSHSLFRWRFPRRAYGIFLCHHKHGAAVLARWFKILFAERTTERVFLDSDELDNLDKLFDIVAHQTKYLVALLTSETTRRIWCAGEIATAVRYKTSVVPVASADFDLPTDDFIDKIEFEWTEAQKNHVQALGVAITDIQAGLHALRRMSITGLDRGLPQASQEHVVDLVFAQCVQLRATAGMVRFRSSSKDGLVGKWRSTVDSNGSRCRSAKAAHIVIVGNMEDPEAACICAILMRLLQMELVVTADVLQKHETNLNAYASARYLIATLTRGVLEDVHFAAVLVEAYRVGRIRPVPVIADVSFQVPGQDFLKGLTDSADVGCFDILAKLGVGIEEIAQAYRCLFSVLAVRFSSHASSRIQAAEIKELAPRVKRRTTKQALSILARDQNSFNTPPNQSSFNTLPRLRSFRSPDSTAQPQPPLNDPPDAGESEGPYVPPSALALHEDEVISARLSAMPLYQV